MTTCTHCGGAHAGACPRIKAIEYFPDGKVRRVEYRDDDETGGVPAVLGPYRPTPWDTPVYTVNTLPCNGNYTIGTFTTYRV